MALKTSFSFPTFRTLSGLFVALSLLVLVVVTLSTAGRVEIQVKPALSTRVVDSFFTLTSTTTPSSGALHADFTSVALEAKAPIEGDGGTVRPEKARYAIAIHNQYSRDQSLVSTTRFLFNSTLYRLLDPVTVKAGTSKLAVVEADQAGTGYTRSKGEKLTIPGLWEGIQPYIFGIVDSEVRPGFVTVTTASQEQIDSAALTAFQILDSQRRELIEGDPSLYVLHQEQDPVKIAPEPGEITATDVMITQPIITITIAQNSLEGTLRDSLSRIEPNKRFFYESSEVQFEVLDWETGSARLRVTIPVRFYTPLSEEQFSSSDFRGKLESEVFEILNDRYQITDAAINYSPTWLKPLLSRFGSVRMTILEP